MDKIYEGIHKRKYSKDDTSSGFRNTQLQIGIFKIAQNLSALFFRFWKNGRTLWRLETVKKIAEVEINKRNCLEILDGANGKVKNFTYLLGFEKLSKI